MYDVVIIGAGVTGCAAARELARYELDICVVERCADVCCGTSKANSAIVHAGYDAKPGTLKAELNVEGNRRMDQIAEELHVPFVRCSSFVAATKDEEWEKLEALYEQGMKNHVPGLRILPGDEARRMEPGLSAEVCAALFAPTAGIICPFELTFGFAENAYENGVEFSFETEVRKIRKTEDGFYELETDRGMIEARTVVNAAGVYADQIHNMVSARKLAVTPRRGQYCLFDKKAGGCVSHVIFQVPGPMGKGVLVTPTIHGNLLAGPTAENLEDREATETTAEGVREVLTKAGRAVKLPPANEVITCFSGLRAHEAGGDFIIEEAEDAKGFVDCVGIASPGLASSPAIGLRVAEIVVSILKPKERKEFTPFREAPVDPKQLSDKDYSELIRREPDYGKVICRCEQITEGEIRAAIRRPLGARSLDGVKRRTRAGMGRCQSGFCSPRVAEILSEELQIPLTKVRKSGPGSELLTGRNGLPKTCRE